MFSTRGNQENAIYKQQTAAAAKPLNQGVKGLGSKTPAGKSVGKGPLHDENVVQRGAKTVGAKDRGVVTTPAGPRNRAPLGNKTTNAKANTTKANASAGLEKPASIRPTSSRARRVKIKVHDADAELADDEVEEREIEYMPPRETPLPDHPDDCWPIDRTYTQLQGDNLTKGRWFGPIHHGEKDPEELSDFEDKVKKLEQKTCAVQKTKTGTPIKKAGLQKTTRDPLQSKAPQTLKSKSAATALATRTRNDATSINAVPKTRPTPNVFAKPVTRTGMPPNNPRYAAARATSNSTLGYSKGRAVSGATRKPLAGLYSDKETRGTTAGPASKAESPAGAALEALFGIEDLVVDDEGEDAQVRGADAAVDFDDGLDDFQLPVPEC